MTPIAEQTLLALRAGIERLEQQAVHIRRTLSRVRVPPALDDPDDLDQYEALTARFARLQDTLLGPFRLIAILELEERKAERVRDLLNYMEKLGIIDAADEWAEMRRLRNAIAHEYWSNREQLAEMFATVASFSRKLLDTVTRLHQYATRFPQI
ncbi:MAG: HepT-like ribonuclease domain-containing protein [Gammaproteobacteria bacterium]